LKASETIALTAKYRLTQRLINPSVHFSRKPAKTCTPAVLLRNVFFLLTSIPF